MTTDNTTSVTGRHWLDGCIIAGLVACALSAFIVSMYMVVRHHHRDNHQQPVGQMVTFRAVQDQHSQAIAKILTTENDILTKLLEIQAVANRVAAANGINVTRHNP